MTNGIVAAKNKNIYKLCEKRIERSTGISMERNYKIISNEALEFKRRREIQAASSVFSDAKQD